MKILYIDDNRLLIDSVKKLLENQYAVDFFCTGSEGLEKACAVQYGLILLDLSLPDMDGLEVCRELRKRGVTIPILVLTVRKDPHTAALLLNSGADDYVTKPFNGDTLKARIAAILRRSHAMHEEKILRIGELEINMTNRQVYRGDAKIALRRKEYDILEYLMVNKGRALTREMIFDNVWEAGKESWNNTVDVHMKYLRDKIDRPYGTSLIKTVYGVGYMLDGE